MDVELVTIGTELLLGFTVDTNSALLGQALAAAGVRVVRRTTVEDREASVAAAVREALGRTGFVITSGGLGPTHDDVTKRAVAELFGVPLEFHPAIWDELVARFARMGRALAERNRCQAEVPRGATVLPNPRGTAPGLWLEGPPGTVVLLPGVPPELRGLVAEQVVPRLASRGGATVVRSLLVRTTGIPESALADRLAPLEPELPPLTCASLPGLDGVDLRLTAWNLSAEEASRRLERLAGRIRDLLGEHVYGRGEEDLAAQLLAECRARGLTLAVAESCTGGMLGARITAIPGSSDVFHGGVIAYDNAIKLDLGVPARTLEEGGAVSEEVARAMAAGARERFRADVAVAITGIAGPSGGSEDKPVGLVWFALAGPAGEEETLRFVFPGSRQDIRARACQYALWKAWLRLTGGRDQGSGIRGQGSGIRDQGSGARGE
jgi:nicotinamide-nucleotide amidase